MSTLGFSTPTIGDQNATADPQILSALTTIIAWANGNVGLANTDTTLTNHFLKLNADANRKIGFGVTATGTWGGANVLGSSLVHGMGLTPLVAFVIAGAIDTFSPAVTQDVVAVSVTGLSATDISYKAATSQGGSTNNSTPLYWLAIA